MRKIELNEKKYERPIYLSLSGVEKWIIILEFQSLMTTQGVCVREAASERGNKIETQMGNRVGKCSIWTQSLYIRVHTHTGNVKMNSRCFYWLLLEISGVPPWIRPSKAITVFPTAWMNNERCVSALEHKRNAKNSLCVPDSCFLSFAKEFDWKHEPALTWHSADFV